MAAATFARCLYCQWVVPSAAAGEVPAFDDDDRWLALSLVHLPGCEWVTTRAHRRDEEARGA